MKNYKTFQKQLLLEKTNLFNKFKEKLSKKAIKYIMVSLLSVYSISQLNNFFASNKIEIPQENLNIIYDIMDSTKTDTIHDLDISGTEIKINHKVDPQNITLSQNGWDHLRDYEKLKLIAYDIGDGKITIGWGHAETKSKSKYKVGDEISKDVADKLFYKDVNMFANATRRMFKQWEEEGQQIKITQGQFDAIVSLMYNGGVSGFRRSNIANYLYNNQMDKASKSILSFKVSDKFSGNYKRRKIEKILFDS